MTSAFWLSFASTMAAMVAMPPLLRWLGILDQPNSRSSHTVAVPRGGGIACAVGLGVALSLGSDSSTLVLATPALALALVGLVDDFRTLGAGPRLVAQFITAMLIVILAEQSGGVPTTALIAAALLIVSYVNAFNFMDGINGISALTACATGAWYWIVGDADSIGSVTAMGAAICGAGLAFLPWNAPRARVFMGDIGSYLFGASIATTAVVAMSEHVGPVKALAPLCIYFADTGWTLVCRARRGENLTSPHRDHIYQRLADRWGHSPAGLVTTGFTVLCILATTLPGAASVCAIPVLAALYLAAPWAVDQTRTASGGKP